MEYIERIFYRKINPSDFKKLYDIDRPEGGGGQTYLEAAGISNEKIVDFLSYAEVSDSPLKDKGETRSVYNFNAYVLGDAKAGSAFIEFAPRACLKIKNCTKHLFLSPFYSIIKKKGCSLC